MLFPTINLALPDWVATFLPDPHKTYPTAGERMLLAVNLAQQNIEQGGGPFGAAIFDRHSHRLIAPGINLVVPGNCSLWHAEMVAIAVAQQVQGSFDLSAPHLPPCELVTSAEPCAMCFGAIPWSGVQRLVCGARREDVEGIGFDEGPKGADWAAQLTARGIEVVQDVCREEATAVLQLYLQRGLIYNAHNTHKP